MSNGILYGLATIGLIVSALFDRGKTIKTLKIAFNVFLKMLPMLLVALSIVSIVLFFLPDYVIADYLGTTAICRIPMSIFEASFLGLKFTIIRYLVSLPLIVISGLIIERILGSNYYERMGLSSNLE